MQQHCLFSANNFARVTFAGSNAGFSFLAHKVNSLMNMDNIDVRDIACFGFSMPKQDCWLEMLRKADGRSWRGVDMARFEKALANNVESSYFRIAGITFVDLDTDTTYFASFHNGLKFWTLEIPDSSLDAVAPKDVVDFFNSDWIKRIAKRCDEILTRALDYYQDRVKPVLEEGKFLSVDETRLEAIEFLLQDPEVRKNLRMAKYKRL